MSDENCEIRYELDEHRQATFRRVVESYCQSAKSESDAARFQRELEGLGLDSTYVLSYDLYDCSFSSLPDNQFSMCFCSRGLYWDEVIFPLIHQLGAKEIFAYVHDSSWGGDIFARSSSGETEYLYMSQRDSEADSFLYDEKGEYVGTTFGQLFSMYRDGIFSPIDFGSTKRAINSKSRSRWKSLIVLVLFSLCVIWFFIMK